MIARARETVEGFAFGLVLMLAGVLVGTLL
jgi:hypothetical protein